MAGAPAARVGSGGIYSLAIMAPANETSVLYREGRRGRVVVAVLLRSRQR